MIQRGPVCPACEAGEHDTINSELCHGLFKCSCACNRRKGGTNEKGPCISPTYTSVQGTQSTQTT